MSASLAGRLPQHYRQALWVACLDEMRREVHSGCRLRAPSGHWLDGAQGRLLPGFLTSPTTACTQFNVNNAKQCLYSTTSHVHWTFSNINTLYRV